MNDQDRELDRLHPLAESMLGRSVNERIAFIERDIFVPYPEAKLVFGRLEYLYKRNNNNGSQGAISPLNMALTGSPGIGKSFILRTFAVRHPRKNVGEYDEIQVLYLNCPPSADRKLLMGKILEVLHSPFSSSMNIETRAGLIAKIFKRCGTRLLIIDEAHNLLNGSHKQIFESLAYLKNLAEELEISIILAGTERLDGLLRMDMQLLSRFPIWSLPKWTKGKTLDAFLRRFESTLPLAEPSNLASNEISSYLAELGQSFKATGDSSGNITLRPIIRQIRNAAVAAVTMGSERITIELLRRCDRSMS